MDRDVTNRGPAICLIWVSRIFKLSFVSRNSSIYFMWFLVKIIAIKVLGGSYTKFATHNLQWMYYFIMRTIVLLICTTLIAQMIVGAVPPNDVTTGVLSQRQQRQDRISIRRRIVPHDRLDRQRQQRLRQQQVRDQNRDQHSQSRASC